MPPPLHGQAIVTQNMVELLRMRCNLRVADLSPRSSHRTLGYHLRKLRRVIRAAAVVLTTRARYRRLYLALDTGWGLVYAIGLIFLARVARYEIYVHHHSYAYITRASQLMRGVVATAGRQTTHIFLCPAMKRHFRTRYPNIGPAIILSNIWQCPPVADAPDSSSTPEGQMARVRLGLLSNLCPEKGLYEFFEVLREARNRGLPVEGVLAGPAVNTSDADLIVAAEREFGEALDYRGPVEGYGKALFYSDIDVFIFPTKYKVESQGLVVLEALSNGVPVIAFGRGCIPSDIKGSGSLSILPGKPFLQQTLGQIETWFSDAPGHAAAREAALNRSRFLFAQATASLYLLVKALTGEEIPTG
jgi:glycosyltransferase involved in cell wall biosynthesis